MNPNYMTSMPGILKIVEAVLCLGGFISAMIPYQLFTPLGGGWVQFVTITAIIGVVLILVMNSCFSDRLPLQTPLIVLIFYLVYDVFLFIAGIIAAVRAGQLAVWFGTIYSVLYPEAIAASAAFVLIALIVFVLDTVFSFNAYRAGGTQSTMSSTHTSQSTTKTTVTVS